MSNASAPLSRSELEAFWLPFTANRQFKAKPRLLAKASGMHYWTPEGRQILDAVAGLWCVNAGHGRREITQAVASQLETLDYAPPFQMGHPGAFALANELVKIAPERLDHVFFTNSGSESVDTALKIALAWHRARGEASRTRLIGRERGYHGVGFGGTGAPFAAQEFGVTPDIITLAKGLTNGCVPMGAVLVSHAVHEAFMQGPEGIELFHGYTYSAHPVACAAALATLGLYRSEGLLTRAKSLAQYWEDAAHALRDLPHVIDVRNYGLILGLELQSIPGKAGARAFEVFIKCFERGVLVRQTGDIIALSPPLIIEQSQIDQIFSTLSAVLRGQ